MEDTQQLGFSNLRRWLEIRDVWFEKTEARRDRGSVQLYSAVVYMVVQ